MNWDKPHSETGKDRGRKTELAGPVFETPGTVQQDTAHCPGEYGSDFDSLSPAMF